MNTVPDDIRKAADALFRRVDKELWRAPADIIAEALMAERERCAKIAESMDDDDPYNAASEIAKDIRNP